MGNRLSFDFPFQFTKLLRIQLFFAIAVPVLMITALTVYSADIGEGQGKHQTGVISGYVNVKGDYKTYSDISSSFMDKKNISNLVPWSVLITIPNTKFNIDIVAPGRLKPDGKLFYDGLKLYHRKNYLRSLSIFKKITTLYPKSLYYPPALIYLSETLIMLNRPDDARTILNKAKEYPSNEEMLPSAFFMLAKSYGKNNDSFEEESVLKLITGNFRNSHFVALANIMLGKLYINYENYRKARIYFKNASNSRYELSSLMGYGTSYAKEKNNLKANLYFTSAYYYTKKHEISVDKFVSIAGEYLPIMLETFCTLREFNLTGGLLSRLKNNPEGIYSRATCLKEQGRYKAASKLFYKAYSTDPTSRLASSAKRSGAIYKIFGGMDLAGIKKIESEYKYDNEVSEIAAIKEAEILIKNKKESEAMTALYRYKKRGEAYSIWDVKLNQLAVQLVDKLMKRYRSDPESIDVKKLLPFIAVLDNPLEIASLLMSVNRFDDAKAILYKTEAEPAYRDRSIVRLAYIALKRNKFKQAEALINSVKRSYTKSDAVYWNVLGDIAFQNGKYSKTINYYKKASKLNLSGSARTNLAYSYYSVGDFKKVTEILGTGKLSPIDYRILGDTAFKLARYNEAVSYFYRAENDNESNLYFAKSLYKIKKVDDAIKILKRLALGGGTVKILAESELAIIKSEKTVKAAENLK